MACAPSAARRFFRFFDCTDRHAASRRVALHQTTILLDMTKTLLHLARVLVGAAVAAWLSAGAQATELSIVMVNNGHMLALQKVAAEFERMRPDIRLRWTTLEEGQLRQQITREVTTGVGQYDVMTSGSYEAPIWGKRGWLKPIEPAKAYDVDDLLPPIRRALSHGGKLYALPFYGEISMTLARSDLLKSAGITLPQQPTWDQVRSAVQQA